MKLRVHRDALLYGVQRVQAVAERRTTLQILSSFLLEARDKTTARIAATNLQIGLEMAVPGEVEQGGTVAVGARTLFEILRNFPPAMVEIEVDEMFWVHVRSGRIHFRIVGASADGYPDLPQPGKRGEPTAPVAIPAETLRGLIERTIFSISSDETRLHLNSALFQGDGKVLRMVTTDGHRMTHCEETVEGDKAFYRHDILIPARGLAELRKLLEGVQGDLLAVFENPYVFFEVPSAAKPGSETEGPLQSVRLAIKLVDATFPPYRQVIPRDNKRQVLVAREVLGAALRRISSISPSRTPTTRLRLEPGKMKISSDNPDIGVGEEEIDIQYDGEPLDIGFNARYLLDVLDVIRGENLQLNLGGSLDGAVLREEHDERFLAVVMPIRI